MKQKIAIVTEGTKHALEGYSESLDHEIRKFNVRSILIEPANKN